MGQNLKEKTPSHHAGKAEGSGNSLPSPQSCMPHHIDEMAGEQLIEEQNAPPTQGSGGSSHSVQTGVGL